MRAPLPQGCASEVGPHHNTTGQIVAKLEAVSRLAGLIANPCEPLWGISSHVRQANLIREAVRHEGLLCQLKSNINFDVRLLRVLVAPSRMSTGLGSSQFWFIFRGRCHHCSLPYRAPPIFNAFGPLVGLWRAKAPVDVRLDRSTSDRHVRCILSICRLLSP
jgi:hypothetical protein